MWLRGLTVRLQALFARDRLERDLQEEFAFHLEMETERNRRRGMSEEEARAAARRSFGSLERHREECREARTVTLVEDLARDSRFAWRTLRRSPGFVVAAMLTLGLGIGANTVVFSLVDVYLLRPLPFAEPGELVHVWESSPREGIAASRVSLPTFRDWQAGTRAFAALALFNYTEENVTGGAEPERVPVGRVSANAFDLLGVEPALGRGFLPGEDQPGSPPVAALSYRYWQSRYGGDPGVLGRTIRIDDHEHVVVGVMPPEFAFPLPITQLWAPHLLDPAHSDREDRRFQVVARLAPGVTREAAQRDLERVARALERQYPEVYDGWTARVVPLRDALNFASDLLPPMLLVLTTAALLLLLIVCANLAGLLLTRASARGRELAIRAALGAGRGRIARQLLTESLLLGLLGAALGVGLAALALRLIGAAVPPDLYRVGELGVDGRVLGYTLALSLLAVALVGIAPAVRALRSGLSPRLADGGRGSSEGVRGRRLQDALVVVQIGLALALLVASALAVQSLHGLRRMELGFRPERVLSAKLILPESRYPGDAEVVAFQERLLAEVRARPGVQAAALVHFLPLNHETSRQDFFVPGTTAPSAEGRPGAVSLFVSPAYFETMGILLRGGRAFAPQDRAEAPRVVIVNEALAADFFPAGDAVGREIRLLRGEESVPATVVGVVGDSRQAGLDSAPEPQIYLPQAQDPWSYLRLLVRTADRPERLVPAVREAVRAVDPELPLSEVRPLSQVVREFLLPQRALSGMLLVLGWGALLLAVVGIYGVMSYQVVHRTREIGVRMALGADAGRILRLVLRRGLAVAVLGLSLGLAGALALSRLLASFLVGIGSRDPQTYAALTLLLGAVALLACYLPARRAVRVDPASALRTD